MSRKPILLGVEAAVLVLFLQWVMLQPANSQQVGNTAGGADQKTVQMVLSWYHNIEMGHVLRAAQYVADDYVDHDPRISGGKDGFIKYYGNASARPPQAKLWTAFAQGDYVVMVWDRADKDPTTGTPYYYTTYDVVRVRAGKIQEHWDDAKKNSPW